MKKYDITITLTIALILCSCSSQSQPPTTSQKNQEPISAQAKQSVKLPEKAKKVCGDPAPTDAKDYPVSFYPVSVEYSDRNLEIVRKHFCEDASKLPSKSLGKDVLQVASFISREKAESFREKLSQHFSQSRVGKPTIVEKPRSDVGDKKLQSEKLSFSTFPSLSEDQIRQLYRLKGRPIYRGSSIKLEVALPTYLPTSMQVSYFKLDGTENSEHNVIHSPSYEILYKDINNSCFRFKGDSGQWGDAPTGWSSVEIDTIAFGKVFVERNEFDKKKPLLSQFQYDIKDSRGIRPLYRYYMASVMESSQFPETKGCKNGLPFDEAVKIIKAIKFLF